jgi:nucleotide-binding universal stress UspA family protein
MSTIVVGVDGSPGALDALRFALTEARLRGAGVRAVAVWHVPVATYAGGYGPGDSEVWNDLEQAARDRVRRALDEVGDLVASVDTETVVREGSPPQVLLEEAQDADLLVLGTRGLGGFRGLLLGSVSQQCAHHTSCPLVIVPHARDL